MGARPRPPGTAAASPPVASHGVIDPLEAPTNRSSLPLILPAFLLVTALVVRAQAPVAPPPSQVTPPPAGPGAPADFTLRVTPDSVKVRRGSSAAVKIEIQPVAAFKGRVRLLASLLLGTDAVFAPAALDNGGTATLTITPGRSAIKGSYVMNITAIDGGISHSVTLSVAVR